MKKICTCHHDDALRRHSAAINCYNAVILCIYRVYYIIFTSTSTVRTLTACGREIRTDVNKNCDIISLGSSFFYFYIFTVRFFVLVLKMIYLYRYFYPDRRHVRNFQASWKAGPKRFLAFLIHNIIFYVLREYEYLHRSGFGRWNTFVFSF